MRAFLAVNYAVLELGVRATQNNLFAFGFTYSKLVQSLSFLGIKNQHKMYSQSNFLHKTKLVLIESKAETSSFAVSMSSWSELLELFSNLKCSYFEVY